MRQTRRIAMLIALLLAFFSVTTAWAAPEDYNSDMPALLQDDHLYGESIVAIDANTGEILYSKDSRVRMYPASTTKIMTLLLAVESGWSFDMEISIPAEADDVPKDSSRIPVYKNETMTFGDLLYGMMMHSGNDGSNAVAVLVSGSVSAFVDRMNARAIELGCEGTHFMNAHGYHDENHYTTALDLAKITKEALKHESIRQILATPSYKIQVSPRGEIPLRSTNELIIPNSQYYYEDCIGVKTGSTSKAGKCFVGAAEKDGVTIITVTLNCSSDAEKWTDTRRLFDFGFTCYTPYNLESMFNMASSRIVTTRISNAKEDDPMGGILQLQLAQVSDPTYERMVQSGNEHAKEEALNDFIQRAQINLTDNLVAPITAGEFVGSFSYTTQDGQLITASLIAGRDIEAQPVQTTTYDVFPFLQLMENPLVQLLIVILVLLVIVIILYFHCKRRRRERIRQARYEKRRREYLRKKRAEAAALARKKAQDSKVDKDLFGDF